MQGKCVSLGDKGVKIQRRNTICSFQRLHPGSRRPAQHRSSTHRPPPPPSWSASTHRSPSGRKQKATTAGPRRLTTASSPLRVTDGTLRPLVVLFRRLRSRRLLLLEAALEEGQHRGHQVVSTLGGGDVVSFIWENLGGEEWKS